MDLNGYFDPVSLEKPEFEYIDNRESFSHHISVHTPDRPIHELDRHQVALMGIPEDRNGFIEGSAAAPDAIRSKLYQLARINRDLKIYDLGNVKNGGSVGDSYFALRDILLELRERKMAVLILGGSQDLGQGVFLALEKEAGMHHILTIDSMLDFGSGREEISSRNYLNLLLEDKYRTRFSFTNLGHQAYFTTSAQLEELDRMHLESIRLGIARAKMQNTEPLIRDAEFVSVDLGVVRHSDAPGASIASPNGFFGDELCQFTRYAGMSDRANILGLFEYNPKADLNEQSAHLYAQAAWYYLDGLANRISEHPSVSPEQMTKFIVNLDAAGHDIIFFKSKLSERWWMEIPVINKASGYNFFVSCTYEDYQQACKKEIPDRWWRYLHRLGNEME